MNRTVFLFYFLLVTQVIYSQISINTTDPFINVKRTVHVADTIKAKERAAQMTQEWAEDYEAKKAPFLAVINLIDSLLSNNVKNVKKDPVCMQLLEDAHNYNHFMHVNSDIEKGVKAGKVEPCRGILHDYRQYQKEQLAKVEKNGPIVVTWESCLEYHEEKQIFQEKNENYRGYLPGVDKIDGPTIRQGWEWIFNEKPTEIKAKYPVEITYHKYDSHPDLRVVQDYYSDIVYDSEGKLVAIANLIYYRFQEWEYIEEDLLRLLCVRDYQNNKYGIKSKGADTQMTIKNKLHIKRDNSEESLALAGVLFSGLRADQAVKQKNKKAYKEAMSDYENSAIQMMESMSHLIDKDGENYVEQLKLDNENNLLIYKIERVDALTFLLSYINRESFEPTAGFLIKFSSDKDPYSVKYEIKLTSPAANLEKVMK